MKFLFREGCHLCDDIRPAVAIAARRAGVGVREIDIDDDDQLVALYGLRIPVVLAADGQLLAEGDFTRRDVAMAIKGWVRGQPRK